ncbi:MAG: hypothetical protein V1679_01240 [Candidatus Peregrinibacteria bacterium]
MPIKLLKNIVVTGLSAVVTAVIVFGGYSIYAAGLGEYYKFMETNKSFSDTKDAYHNSMNKFFNDKIGKLYELLKKDDFYNQADFKVPEKVEVFDQNSEYYFKKDNICGGTNLSSYCVGLIALDMYSNYLVVLANVKENLPIDDGIGSSGLLPTKEDILGQVEIRNDEINLEIKNAEKVMTATVALYDEFRRAYPMHRKYETLFKTLTKYRQALKKIQYAMINFPKRFADATSSECK